MLGWVVFLLTQVRQQPLIELIDGVQVTALTQDTEQVHIEAKRGDEVLKLESKAINCRRWT